MTETILLFDMDGVLLEPRGYHRALQETVRLVGNALGYQAPLLSQRTIHGFEALGITSEWDSAAVCLALMLKETGDLDRPPEVPHSLAAVKAGNPAPSFPDWDSFLNKVEAVDFVDSPLEKAVYVLGSGLPMSHQQEVLRILENARDVKSSLTHRVFQELVLGSEEFQQTYLLEPQLEVDSYLNEHDRPTLSPSQIRMLNDWTAGTRRAAIFTNRPSNPGGEMFGTPEAELGAALVGLEHVPLVGYGEMRWGAERFNLSLDQVRKPSPVHALAALRAALGADPLEAVEESVRLVHQGREKGNWWALAGAQVWVFEDTPAGLESGKAAQQVLAEEGVDVSLVPVGIARDEVKIAALEARGARVYPDLGSALSDLVGIE
jgi:beta-phosphoglucomutase-like phosphatase (HAD superfamily)